jgi:hypothetical protein
MPRSLVAAVATATACCLAVDAQLDPAPSETITVYHVNPDKYGAAPLNMNTGSASGDLYFDLRSVYTPLECAHPSSSTAHDCDNIEVTAPDLAITKLQLEVDNRYGDYGRCNICGPNGTGHLAQR